MKINKSGGFSGKMGNMIVYSSKFGSVGRNLPKTYYVKNTSSWVQIKVLIVTFSAIWKALPDELKNAWELFAKWRGSASTAERVQTSSYTNCPVRSRSWQAKVMSGRNAFIGLNILAATSNIDVPRLAPPLGEDTPPNPTLEDMGYDRERGVLKVQLTTPNLTDGEKASDRKVIFWINVNTKGKYIASRKKFLIIDAPPNQSVLPIEFNQVPTSGKYNNYQPILFAELPRAVISLAAQMVVAVRPDTAPLASVPSNVLHRDIINSPELVALEEGMQAGLVKGEGLAKFNSDFVKQFLPTLEGRLAEIKSKEDVQIKGK